MKSSPFSKGYGFALLSHIRMRWVNFYDASSFTVSCGLLLTAQRKVKEQKPENRQSFLCFEQEPFRVVFFAGSVKKKVQPYLPLRHSIDDGTFSPQTAGTIKKTIAETLVLKGIKDQYLSF